MIKVKASRFPRIPAGTPLFQIDACTYEVQSAALAAAKAVFARYVPLLDIKAVSQSAQSNIGAHVAKLMAERAATDFGSRQ